MECAYIPAYVIAGGSDLEANVPRADRRDIARKARETTLSGFEKQLDPEGQLPRAERREAAVRAYRQHMSRLASKSGRARRAARRLREEAAELERLAEARSQCAHIWPDVLDVDSMCIYCELPYGEYEAPEPPEATS